jgi:hypothetical protein
LAHLSAARHAAVRRDPDVSTRRASRSPSLNRPADFVRSLIAAPPRAPERPPDAIGVEGYSNGKSKDIYNNICTLSLKRPETVLKQITEHEINI